MTEESTTTVTDDEAPASEDASADQAATDAGNHVEAAEPGKSHWYQRSTGGQSYLDRYVFPALVPLISVAIIIFYVINVSRVFLSGTSTIAVVTAASITIAILVFAAAISSAVRMRSQSLAVFVSVCALAVMIAGWIAVGHAQEDKAEKVVACTPVTGTVSVSAETNLKFNKSSYSASAGCVEFKYGGAAGHTLTFDPQGPTSPILSSAGGAAGTFAWKFTAGTYTFFCDIPGHRAAGMVATLQVK